MNKRNTNLPKSFKRILSFLLAAVFSISLLAGSGCNNAKKIEDYPEPVVAVAPVEDDESGNTETATTKETVEEEKVDEVFLDEFDSLKERGKFEYNPVAINPVFKKEVKNNPKIVRVAKLLLQTVYDTKEKVELTGDLECTEGEFKLARNLAELSSPVMYCVEFDTEDNQTYNITYFPTYSVDEFDDWNVEGGVSSEEAKEKINEFEDYITEIVNSTLTDQDDNMQRAAKIYKTLIENHELDYAEMEAEEEEESMSGDDEGLLSVSTFTSNDLEAMMSDKIHYWQLYELYSFLMVQLNVECMMIGCSGKYQQQSYSILDKELGDNGGWFWMVVNNGEESYHCDLLMDKMALDSQRESFEGYESDMIYFGMSDETREKSFKMYYKVVMQSLNPTNQTGVPVCEKDYKLEL